MTLTTLAGIVAEVRSLINETTAAFWSDAEIGSWINEAQEEIGHETFCLRTYKTYTILADDIFDEREFRMDSDFIAIDEGLVYYNDVACYPTTMARLVRENDEWRSGTGTPARYYIRGDMLGFDNKISAGDTVKFYQIERATTLAASLAPFNGDYRLINFRKLLRDYAVSMAWYKKGEDTKGDRWWARYLKGLEDMKMLLNIDIDNSYQMIPEDHPAKFYPREHFPEWGQS